MRNCKLIGYRDCKIKYQGNYYRGQKHLRRRKRNDYLKHAIELKENKKISLQEK